MKPSEVAYRLYLDLYNKFSDTRFETTEEAIEASRAVSDQLVAYKVACDAEYKAAEEAWAASPEGIQEAADIAAYRAYNAQFEEATDASL